MSQTLCALLNHTLERLTAKWKEENSMNKNNESGKCHVEGKSLCRHSSNSCECYRTRRLVWRVSRKLCSKYCFQHQFPSIFYKKILFVYGLRSFHCRLNNSVYPPTTSRKIKTLRELFMNLSFKRLVDVGSNTSYRSPWLLLISYRYKFCRLALKLDVCAW